MEQVKTCTRCGHTKPVYAFYRNRATRDGYHAACKACIDEYQRSYRERQRRNL